jgi:hypothetical protein
MPVVTLFVRNKEVYQPGGNATPIDPGVTSVTINTDIMIPVIPTPSCESILNDAKASSSFSDFSKKYNISAIIDNLSSFRSQLSNKNIDQNATVDDIKQINTSYVSQVSVVVDYITKILALQQIPVLELVATCLQETTQVDHSAYASKEDTLDESKSRYESTQNQEKHVSYYEGWFPLFRPMRELILFCVFGGSLLFLILSIFMFLRMGGVEIQVMFPNFSGSSYGSTSQPTGSLMRTYPGIIFSAVLVGGIVSYYSYKNKYFQ